MSLHENKGCVVMNGKSLRAFAKDEVLAYHLYKMVADKQVNQNHKEVLMGIAKQEKKHLEIFNSMLDEPVTLNDYSRHQYRYYKMIHKIFGSIFTLRLFEKRERSSHIKYAKYIETHDELREIAREEKKHENKLEAILKDEKLLYASSIVLGMNDALVEMSGAIAGFTIALANTKQISVIAAITGIAAALSMASSEYLSSKQDDHEHPIKSAFYTGFTYLVVVMFMILPYIFLQTKFLSLGIMIGVVVTIIMLFNLYISIAKKQSFIKNFLIMVLIALIVSFISFSIGYLINFVT